MRFFGEESGSWLEPLFSGLKRDLHIKLCFTILNTVVIKGLAYINVNWDAQSMWEGQGWGDSRVEVNDFILDAWLSEINQEKWMNSSPELFDLLGYEEITGTTYNKKERKPDLYYCNGEIYLQSENMEQNSEPLNLLIIDSIGRQIFQKTIFSKRRCKVDLESGYYIAIMSKISLRSTASFYVN